MYKIIIILFTVFISNILLLSSSEKDLWIFGKGASLQFDSPSGSPYALSSEFLIDSPEAAATGFDNNGKLLFYSDGESIWNYENTQIYSELKGSSEATQGITVFKFNTIDSLFFLLTQSLSTFRNGSYLYKLDFRTDNKGKVTGKPDFLEESKLSYERLEIIPHYNQKDFWFILNPHYTNNSEYLVYFYDGYKLYLQSRLLSDKKRNFNEGYLKSSPDGRFLVSADIDGNSIEMLEFDNQIGELRNPKIYKDTKLDAGVYGIEFSNNSNYLYLTIYQHLTGNSFKSLCLQIDFNSIYYNDTESTYEVFNLTHTKGDGGMWGIKRGINNRIYIARENKNYLSVINNPNAGGLSCQFLEKGPNITTNNDLCFKGLPSTVSTTNVFDYEIVEIKKCENGYIQYVPKFDIDYSQYRWLGNNRIINSKNLTINNLELKDAGLYYLTNKTTNEVKVAVRLLIGSSEEINFITSPSPIVCNIDTISIRTENIFEKYEWSNGKTDSIIKVTESGTYTLKATTEYGCEVIKEIQVLFVQSPEFEIEAQLLDCDNTYKLTCTEEFDNYNWSNGDTSKSTIVYFPGKYELNIKYSEQCQTTKVVELKDVKKEIKLEFPNGSFICDDEIIIVNIINPDKDCIYNWSNGSKATSTAFNESGVEYVEATDTTTGCVFRKEFEISTSNDFKLKIKANYDCNSRTIYLSSNADTNSFDYFWSNGSEEYTINVKEDETYRLFVQTKSKICEYYDTIKVNGFDDEKIQLDFPQGKYLCNNNSILVSVLNPSENYIYKWSNGENGSETTIDKPGSYNVTSINKTTGCEELINFEINSLIDFSLQLEEHFECDISTTIITSNTSTEVFDFEWSNGQISDSLYVTEAGEYWLKASTKNGCIYYDTIMIERVRSFDLEITSYPNDTICAPGFVILKIDSISPKITAKRWSNGSRKDSIIIDKSGRYIIEANDKNYCYVRDTVFVKIITPPKIDIISSKGLLLCEGNQTILSISGLDNLSDYSYEWSNGLISPSIVVTQEGNYSLIVKAKGTDCADSASITINTKPKPTVSLFGELKFCEGGTTTIYSNYSNGKIIWSNGSEEDSIVISQSGIYYATVYDTLGCEVSDTVYVETFPTPSFEIIGENSICSGDTTILECSENFSIYKWSDESTENNLVVTKAGIYSLTVIDSNGCSNSATFEVYEEINSFYVSDIHLLNDSLLIEDSNSLTFMLNNYNSKSEISLETETENRKIKLNTNEKVKVKLEIRNVKLGENRIEVNLSNNGNCKKDTMIILDFKVYTVLEAQLSKKYYPYLNEKVKYPINFSSTIPLDLNLTYEFQAPETIFYPQTNTYFDENITINKRIQHEITGLTLLGNPYKQETYFNLIETNNPYVIIDTINGSIEVGQVCLNDFRLVEYNLFEGINIYPNPTVDYITLELVENNSENVEIEIINMSGEVLLKNEFIINGYRELDLIDIPVGSYILNIKSNLWQKQFRFNILK